jgi:hypothetical protein
MRRSIGAVLAALFFVSTPAGAQIPPRPIPTGVRVPHAHATPLRDAVITHARRAATSRRASIRQAQPPRRNWFARHPVLTGTMVGAGVGLAWIAAEGCSSSDYTCTGLVLFSVGTGAGLGALGGLVGAAILK